VKIAAGGGEYSGLTCAFVALAVAADAVRPFEPAIAASSEANSDSCMTASRLIVSSFLHAVASPVWAK
jgi:hypothetical protein